MRFSEQIAKNRECKNKSSLEFKTRASGYILYVKNAGSLIHMSVNSP